MLLFLGWSLVVYAGQVAGQVAVDLELLTPLFLFPSTGVQACMTLPLLCDAWAQTQSFLHARQGFLPPALHPHPDTHFKNSHIWIPSCIRFSSLSCSRLLL